MTIRIATLSTSSANSHTPTCALWPQLAIKQPNSSPNRALGIAAAYQHNRRDHEAFGYKGSVADGPFSRASFGARIAGREIQDLIIRAGRRNQYHPDEPWTSTLRGLQWTSRAAGGVLWGRLELPGGRFNIGNPGSAPLDGNTAAPENTAAANGSEISSSLVVGFARG